MSNSPGRMSCLYWRRTTGESFLRCFARCRTRNIATSLPSPERMMKQKADSYELRYSNSAKPPQRGIQTGEQTIRQTERQAGFFLPPPRKAVGQNKFSLCICKVLHICFLRQFNRFRLEFERGDIVFFFASAVI